MKCPYCGYQEVGRPRYCSKCGHINEDDIAWNVWQVREYSKQADLAAEDLQFLADAHRHLASASLAAQKVDLRTPLEIWATRTGYVAGGIGLVLLAVSWLSHGQLSDWGLVLLILALGLLGATFKMSGRFSFGPRASCMIIVFLVGGILGLIGLLRESIFPYTGPVQDKASVLYNCYRWDRIGPSMIGSTQCVYGKILKYSDGPATSDIYFGDSPSAFHLISTEYEFPNVQAGECVKATGKVASSYGSLFMDISDLFQVTPVSSCERSR